MCKIPLAVLFLPLALSVSAAGCEPAGTPTRHEAEPGTVTILATYYVRFRIDGESYHAVPIDRDDLLRRASGGYLFEGPAYVRRKGEVVWRCHPRGYQVPHGAKIMISSSRAPVTITTLEGDCW
jgi:hypothetical protein